MDPKPKEVCNAEQVPPVVPAPNAEAEAPKLDPAELRKIVGLGPEATDSELITQLAIVIAAQKAHIDTLSGEGEAKSAEVDAMKGEMANHFVAAYSEVLPVETHAFWREQFITNRAATITAVEAFAAALPARPAAPAAAPKAAPEPVVPLKNALEDRPRTLIDLTGAPTVEAAQAAAILNRAQVLQHELKLEFPVAWERAQAELSKPK